MPHLPQIAKQGLDKRTSSASSDSCENHSAQMGPLGAPAQVGGKTADLSSFSHSMNIPKKERIMVVLYVYDMVCGNLH